MPLVERIRAALPGVALRTAFIVGFPGETENDFEKLLEFVELARFDHVGVFKYSDEEGTEAHGFPERVPQRVKERRRRRLMALQRRISRSRNEQRVGERVEVLVEGTHPETDFLLQGRLATQAPEIDGAVLINDETAPAGTFVMVRVTEAHPYDLVGHIESEPGAPRP